MSSPARRESRLRIEPDPVIEAYKADLDRTLLRESLKKTPEQRLNDLQRLYDFAAELRQAGDRLRRA